MNAVTRMIKPQWQMVVLVLVVAVLMTLIYDYTWQLGLPLALRNLAGLILFFCIMAGCGVAYVGARINGASYAQGIKIGLVIPIIWHVKEMMMAINFYGVGAGIYAGIQGPYLFYYGLMFLVMGLFHLAYQLWLRVTKKSGEPLLKSTLLFLLPFTIVGGLEGLVMAIFNFDLFVFQGFLAGYRSLFM